MKRFYILRRFIMGTEFQSGNTNGENLIFLNLPVSKEEDDVIGFDTYADNLSCAIDSGAQMIGVTSPFGTGKTSVIELLQKKRACHENEQIIKIPMWSYLSNISGKSISLELHKTLVYQIASQIDHNKGTYINRRLSSNYGLLKLHVNKICYFIISLIVLITLAMMWLIENYANVFGSLSPYIKSFIGTFNPLLVIGSLILGVIVLFRAEIIFSSKKSEKERVVEADEIIDIYRLEILKYKKFSRCKCINRKKTGKRYIIVIEDLDRINDGNTVIQFLTELRKYYIPYNGNNNSAYKNEVIFITTIKPEKILYADYKMAKDDKNKRRHKKHDSKETDNTAVDISLYDKIFDYVLNLQMIHTDDYNAILEGILKPRREALAKIGLTSKNDIMSIPGMEWITYGDKISIREIKYRLNKSIVLFQLLKKRFPDMKNISYEKCAIAAYLTTTFEKEFANTPHIAFKELTDKYITKGDLSKNYCAAQLKTQNESYIDVIIKLIKAKHIDSTYHMYFYNYPKGSRMLTYEEIVVQKAILYGEKSANLNKAIDDVISYESTIIKDSLEKIRRLRTFLPEIVFENEKLYTETIKYDRDLVYLWMRNLDYSPEAFAKTKKQIISILKYNIMKQVYAKGIIFEFCKIWEEKFKEKDLLSLRKEICGTFSNEILWYEQLFFGDHNLISEEEMDKLSLRSIVQLINIDSESFTRQEFNYVIDRFCKNDYDIAYCDIVKTFIFKSSNYISNEDIAVAQLKFMQKTKIIDSAYENTVTDLILSSNNKSLKVYLFKGYQSLINIAAIVKLKDETLRCIQKLDVFSGYKSSVADALHKKGYFLEAIAVRLENGLDIYLDNAETFNILTVSKSWLISHEKYLRMLRDNLIKGDSGTLLKYKSLFQEEYPTVSTAEMLMLLTKFNNINIIKELIAPQQINLELADELIIFLHKYTYVGDDAYDVLDYVFDCNKEIVFEFLSKLDFQNYIRYDTIDVSKKAIIKSKVSKFIDVHIDKGKLEFMRITKTLDEDWLTDMYVGLNKSEELKKSFVDVVNNCRKNTISETAIEIICSFKSPIVLEDTVLDALYKHKEYECYAASKIYKEKKFVFEKSSVLWSAYVEVFTDDDYSFARSYMAENEEFLNELIKKQEYKGMTHDSRMVLTRVLQDSQSLQNVVEEYDLGFAHEYYSKIKGFVDRKAEEKFLSIIKNKTLLLNSEEIKSNVYHKLDDVTLKRKYTRMQNEQKKVKDR